MTKKSSSDQVLDQIFENLPQDTEIVADLPSRGKFYKLTEPGEPIKIRPMRFEDEKVLASFNGPQHALMSLLFSRCISNLPVTQIIGIDKLYLMLKIRELSYGPLYRVGITCPKCGKLTETDINISDFPISYLPDEITNPREVELKVLKKEAQVHSPTMSDDQFTSTVELMHNNLWRYINHIAGCKDKKIIQKALEKMPLSDVHSIVEAVNMAGYGLDHRFLFECSNKDCMAETLMEAPFGEGFFTTS